MFHQPSTSGAVAAANSPCRYESECDEGEFCKGFTIFFGAFSFCVKQVPDGGLCVGNHGCVSGTCNDNRCDYKW